MIVSKWIEVAMVDFSELKGKSYSAIYQRLYIEKRLLQRERKYAISFYTA